MPAILLLALASTTPAPPSPWAELARRDVRAARDAIRENHPGPVDPADPGFNRRMAEAFAAATERAARADSFDGYAAALRSFVAAFHDGHLGAPIDVARLSLAWPGFLPARRGGRYVVREPEGADAPAPGAEILSCDGRSLDDWMARDVFPFAAGSHPDLESSRVRLAPQILVDAGNPFRARAERCRVAAADGPLEVELQWRSIDRAALEGRTRAAGFGEVPGFALRDFSPDGVWASMPSLAPDAAGESALHAMIAAAPLWRSKRTVVLDVRGNTGGSSLWGHDLLEAFYGAVPASPSDAALFVEWRVSPGNQLHLAEVAAQLGRQFGPDSPAVAWARRVRAGLHGAARLGQSLYREAGGEESPATREAARPDPAALAPRVYLVTDGRCGSACDDFVEVALRYPNVVHVGAATDVDSPYMEVRSVPLPSGIASLNLATKVYRNRPRTGKPFVPSRVFDGELSDTAALENWVRSLADVDPAR